MTIEIENEGVSFINIGDTPQVVNISSTMPYLQVDDISKRYFYRAECDDPANCKKITTE